MIRIVDIYRAIQLFAGIVWRRIDDRVPDRLDLRTAWKVARAIHNGKPRRSWNGVGDAAVQEVL
jgi:hypothetical protein